MGGDHDHRSRCQPRGQFETALAAQVDVDQRHIGVQLRDPQMSVGDVPGRAHDGQALAFQQVTGSEQELPIVVDEQAAQIHPTRVPVAARRRIPASR
jgi:hypothetical protein